MSMTWRSISDHCGPTPPAFQRTMTHAAREALTREKDLSDTLRHMARDSILKRMETGRYIVAEGW
jgi:hypothetical protein